MGACGFLAASHTVANPSGALASRNAFRGERWRPCAVGLEAAREACSRRILPALPIITYRPHQSVSLVFVSVRHPDAKETCAMLIYCAICGAPHREVKIAPQPRTAAFQAALTWLEKERSPVDWALDEPFTWDERHSYDCSVITKEETEWMKNVALLGFNPTARGHDQ